jgi:hypothetical protein
MIELLFAIPLLIIYGILFIISVFFDVIIEITQSIRDIFLSLINRKINNKEKLFDHVMSAYQKAKSSNRLFEDVAKEDPAIKHLFE